VINKPLPHNKERMIILCHIKEFRRVEGTTIVAALHKSAIITLAERLSKVIITLKTKRRKTKDVKEAINSWFKAIPKNLIKSITFDSGKESVTSMTLPFILLTLVLQRP